MHPQCQPYDIGCEPEGVEPVTLIQGGAGTYLLFSAWSPDKEPSGMWVEQGIAVVRCTNCCISKCGYPNDEGQPDHPLYDYGIGNCKSFVIEVRDSPWLGEVVKQRVDTAEAIFRNRATSASWVYDRTATLRHFIILFKEETFECIADDLAVVGYFPTFDRALEYVCKKLQWRG